MSKKKPGQFYELREAKKKLDEALIAMEKLIKDQKILDQKSVENHKEKFIEDVNETSKFLETQFKEVLKDLEKHKNRLNSLHKFIRRHYKLK